ncbi:MAG: tetratricopeptide repeat protein, partial [Myxococcaceae bacterium]
ACERTAPTVSNPTAPPVRIAYSSEASKPVESALPDAGVKKDTLGLDHEHRGRVNHVERAKEMKAVGDFEGALTEARRALFHDSMDEDALAIIIRLTELVGGNKLMVDALARMGEVHPEDPMPLIKQARVLVGMNKNKEAIEVAQNALLRDGEEPEAYHALGRAYLARGELSRAIELFQQTVELSPEHGYALNNLGFAYLRANMNEEAIPVLTRAADVLPAVAFVQNNLGVALERVGRVDEAKDAFSLATSLSPKYVKAQVNAKRIAKLESVDDLEIVEPTEPDAAMERTLE